MALHVTHEPEIDFSTFPETDGKPMADNEVNQEQMIELILELRQAESPQGHHVGGNLLIYYNPENGWDHISPDVFVALDAGPDFRESWKVWVEGKFPEVIFEVASPSTQHIDIKDKVGTYERLGAHEYYIYDPAGRLQPAFRGYARQDSRLVLLPNPTGVSITSPLLGLELRVVDRWLRVIDPATGNPYPSPAEEQRLRVAAELQAVEEVRLRQEAEEARLAAEEARLAAEEARQAAEARAMQEVEARQVAEQARLSGQNKPGRRRKHAPRRRRRSGRIWKRRSMLLRQSWHGSGVRNRNNGGTGPARTEPLPPALAPGYTRACRRGGGRCPAEG
jgi:Uma2 family endonuclease